MASKEWVGNLDGIPYESEEEYNFLLWALELKEIGIIINIQRADSISLSPPLKMGYTKITELKTKVKEEEKEEVILNKHEYTPEYKILWSSSHPGALKFNLPIYSHVESNGRFLSAGYISYIEVKPLFDQNNMTRLFKLNQKWIWDKHKIFINLVVPPKLFSSTFTPIKYLKTKTGKDRKISWKIQTLPEFLNK